MDWEGVVIGVWKGCYEAEFVQMQLCLCSFNLQFIKIYIMSQETKNILKWGDIIRIHGVNMTKEKQQQSKGLIISKGFTDSNIYYQRYSQFQKVNFYQQSLFQILPQTNFDMHDQLAQIKDIKGQHYESLKGKAKGQIENLNNNLKKNKGIPVQYGAQAIFRHVVSNSYLKGLLKASDTGDGAFMIQVSPEPSSKVTWKIGSHRSYQHDGDAIYFDDELLIYHVSTDCYMNFAQNTKIAYLDIVQELKGLPEGNEGLQYKMKRPIIKRPQEMRISIVNENKNKCYWKFIHHCTQQQFSNKQKIKSHDIVYFEHTKNQGCISSNLTQEKYYLKENVDKKQSFQCFWELIPKVVSQLEPQKCNDFYARNVVTGKYLSYNGFKIQIKRKDQTQEGGGFFHKELIKLICDQNGKMLQRGSLIPKDPNVKQIIKFSESLYQIYELTDVVDLTQDSFLIMKAEQDTIMNLQFVISSHEHLIKFLDRFISHMVGQNQRKQTKIVTVEKSKTQDKKAEVMVYDFSALKSEELQNVRYILELLAGKIYGTTYAEILSSGNTPNPLIQKILVQTGTTQLLIQIIYHLFVPFVFIQQNTQASSDRSQRTRLQQVFERVYKLLQKIVVRNDQNKFYLSRWTDIFLKHSKNINKEYIQQCLVGILQNNPKAIEATITKKEIEDLIQCFYKEATRMRGGQLTTKYLRLFSTFIKCESRVLKENQNIILDKFFKDEQNKFCYRFRVQAKEDEVQNALEPMSKIKGKRVQIALSKQDFSSINKYFKDWGPKWNYFLHFVNLLADVCMDKNINAIENVSALVSLQIVAVILFDPEMAKLNDQIRELNEESLKATGTKIYPLANVYQPFVRIAHYIYIYNSKFVPIKTIKNINRWYRHQGQQKGIVRHEDINRTKRAFEGQKEEQQKFYLTNILNFISRFIEDCNQDNANLDILYTVLGLFKETIQLGLWESISQFRKLIPLLIMRIVKTQNAKIFDKRTVTTNLPQEIVKFNKQSFSFNRPEISLNINCKIKASEIFKLINQLEIDIRLRYMMNFFKGLYEATEIFEDYNKQQPELEMQNQSIHGRNQAAKQSFLKSEYAAILGSVKKISQDQDIMLKENIWCNKFKQLTPFQYKGPSEDMSKDRYLFQGQAGNRPTFQFLVLSLFQLPVYNNDNLLSSSLKMLRQIFQQRKNLIQQFKSILICGKGNLNEVYIILKYMREKFEMLTNPNILKVSNQNDDSNFPYKIKKTFDFAEKNSAHRSGILQDLFFLSRTLKEDINLKNIESLMSVQDSIFNKNIVFNYLNEKQRNNKLFQAVNIAEGIYIPLITYIQLIGDNPVGDVHRKILFAIYQYLALLCFNNLQSKQKLMQYVPYILPHLKRRVGAANFLYYVSLDNKLLISNTSLVRMIIDASLQACVQIDKQDMSNNIFNLDKESLVHYNYEKSQILFALRGILLMGNSGFRINQETLMNRFQDNKFKKLIYKNKIQFTGKRDNFSLSPEESYVANFFELFSLIVESKNFINVGKLQNIHPYTYCLDCLKDTNRWQIRRALRAYINRLYYVNKDRDVFLFQQFIRKEFKIINDQLDDLIMLHKNKLINDQVIIPNGIRFKFAQSQVIQMILQIFVTIEEMLLKPDFLKVLKRQIEKEQKKNENQRQIHDQFKKLLHNLGCLNILYPAKSTMYPSKSTINSFILEIKKHIDGVMLQFSEKYLEKQSRQNAQPIIEEQDDLGAEIDKKNYLYDHSKSFFSNLACMIRDIKDKKKKQQMKLKLAQRQNKQGTPQELKKLYIDLIFACQGQNLKPMQSKKFREVSSSLYKPHIQTANSKIFKVIAKPDLSENQENIQLNRRLSIVKDIIDESPVFRKLKQDQFFKLVTTLTNIDSTSKDFYVEEWKKLDEKRTQPVIPLKQIFSRSFNLIMNNHNTISDDQKIFVIKIARCYITQAVQQKQRYKLPVDKWGPDYYSGQQQLPENETQSELIKRQNIIQECGGSAFIESIFKFYAYNLDSKRQLLNETLLLGIAYLFNGNTNCQNSIHRVLTNDAENCMLLNVQRLINSIGTMLIQIRKIKQIGKVRNFAYEIVDRYDFFDVRNNSLIKQFGNTGPDKFQAKNQKDYELALCRIFRFLQLFCENGNNQMKKFLLQQTNDLQGTQKKTNSVNFIATTTLLLRKLFKVMNDKVVGIPSILLDFINQISQLPCIDNQKSFMKTTFFEDLSYLADFFIDEKNLQGRKFNLVAQTDDQPICQLRAIYQKGIQLALCNFEGNDNELIWQFLQKCQAKFLWIVIKQNLLNILGDLAEQYGVSKNEDQKQSDYQRRLISQFTKQNIQKYIKQEQQKANMLNQNILNILPVLYILKKIKVFQLKCQQLGYADKDRPNYSQIEKAQKAKAFRQQLINYAKQVEGYQSIDDFLQKFDNLILSIEVNSFNGKEYGLQYIYFPLHPVFQFLAPETKDSIMMRVKRQTQRDKQTSLIQLKDEVYEQIQANYQLKYGSLTIPIIQKSFKFQITSQYAQQVRKSARTISFTICALLFAFIIVDHDKQQWVSTFTYSNNLSEIILRVAAALQLLYTFWFISIWVMLRRPLAMKKYDNEGSGQQLKVGAEQQTKKKKYSELEGFDLLISYYKTGIAVFQPYFKKIKTSIANNWVVRNVFISFYALSQYESGFLSILMFVVATLLGNFVGVQWYTIHLFDIFTSYSELTNIFKAILNNFKKLALLSFLAGVFILVFNVVSLNVYTSVMWQDDLPEDACQDVIGCVLTLYTSGAIGDSMTQFDFGRFVFDIVFVVFMEIMFQNIVGGIMIDAFSSLKEEDNARNQDKQSKCYICGMDKTAMERSGTTFEKHIHKHNLWYYLYYIYVLSLKSSTDFTGLEYVIDKKVRQEDVEWFPALGEGDTGGAIQETINELKGDIRNVFSQMQTAINSSKDAFLTVKFVGEQLAKSNVK